MHQMEIRSKVIAIYNERSSLKEKRDISFKSCRTCTNKGHPLIKQ